ncbi:class I glutamine amidotransferase-like protein [Athelia psychrophila]|uniref:Class I glutamine amidotransferase-like protein n=1 Tax=Athelia psychrophila TaxID=1759441 RepID=A0A166DCN6_9AGAM|nr:class I glutamine amidotransferase-like protein [Fibularhizoctonia sp. CBS 109695]
MPQTLTIAVCICEDVTLSDFIPPIDIIAQLNSADHNLLGPDLVGDAVPYRVKVDYLAPTLDPVKSASHVNFVMPTVNPTKTYQAAIQEGIQYDILWIPTGPLPDMVTGADRTPPSEYEFIKAQSPGAKYVLSVCMGSMILANAGLLSGKRATTNKAFFRVIEKFTPKDIQWVTKARWVVDEKFWTSSGLSAGSDMALAFVEHLTSPEISRAIRGNVEVTEHTQDDDPFAAIHGLV